MRILYAIQGTGNGHLTRSASIIKELEKMAEVDILVSGIHNEIDFPLYVKYRYRGLGFVFGKKGGINYYQTFKQNKLQTFFSEIKNLPIEQYHFVISDFEPVSVWAAKRAGIPTIGISNQATILNSKIRKPGPGISLSRLFMENYALCDHSIGLHFEKTGRYIETPVIRDEIRHGKNGDDGFGLVYLPAYSDEIIFSVLQNIPEMDWIVFSKHSKQAYRKGHIRFEPINGKLFTEKLLNCHMVISAAGFGTSSEALHLGKKLLVIPMKNQYEQTFNAYSLRRFGVGVLKTIPAPDATYSIRQVLQKSSVVGANYPDNAKQIVNTVFELYDGPIFQDFYQNRNHWDKPLDYYLNPHL